jgi:aminoglycoside phosphotransferase (APT) family kinase protein
MVDAALFAELQTLCRRSFPQRFDQGITQIRSLKDGRNPIVSFSLTWREGKRPRVERLIVRRYADRWTWWTVNDGQKTQREWTVMRWLFGRGLPVPQPYASGTEGQHEYLLMPDVTGGPALATNEAHVEAFAALLAQIHGLTAPEAVRPMLPEASIETELARLRDMAYRCHADGLLDATAELYRQLEVAPGTEETEVPPLCVLHGDPRFANVHCDAQGVTALLGWENAALGDPRWDVARVVNDLRGQEADALVERFCIAYQDRGGPWPVNLTYWETLTATQSWALVEWVTEHAPVEDAAGLLAKREYWQECAWRALTRLRYGNSKT